MNKKYLCHLCLSAEGDTTGTMMLTKEEYEIIKCVADTNNWDNLKRDSWNGMLGITCEELDDKVEVWEDG